MLRHMKKTLTIAVAAAMVCSCNFQVPQGIIDVINSLAEEQPEGIVAGGAVTSIQESGFMELPAVESDDVILSHKAYTISYNADARIPEWVAYELTADEVNGNADRDDSVFQMDPQYRKTQAMREDYTGSGWTRGHMACAADFRWDDEAMDETFYLTNICPQDEELNAGDWNYLEKQVRWWARDFGRVWVVSGPIIGSGKYGTIGERDVVVPDAFFKAVLTESKGKYRSIAFIMGNDDKRYYLADCSMTVNDLESLTGIDFFPALPDDVEEEVESQLKFKDWGIKAR